MPRDAVVAGADDSGQRQREAGPPQHAAGKTATATRTTSSWNVIHGLGDSDGLIGQNGSARAIMNAAHATPSVNSSWLQASAVRGLDERAMYAPALLPAPSATRKTARMIEKV